MSLSTASRIPGAALAVIAAGLAGGASAQATAVPAGSVELVHCSGVNICGGHNDCKTAANSCKGTGSCKGSGFVAAPAKACADIGGTVIDPGKTKVVAESTLIQCYGINQCKGHNDCKTADHACKGQGSCKGSGWVSLPAPTCANVGGTAS